VHREILISPSQAAEPMFGRLSFISTRAYETFFDLGIDAQHSKTDFIDMAVGICEGFFIAAERRRGQPFI